MGKKLSNLLLFLLVTAALAAMTFYIGRDQPGVMIYNFVFLVFMAVIYLGGMFAGTFRLISFSSAFRRAQEELKTIFKKPGRAEMHSLAVLDGIFSNRYLDRRMDSFVNSISASVEGIEDLEEYINEDEIDIHIHKKTMEIIPDIFTSLGILGTFLGLVWGLKAFNPSNYSAMTSSVESLVDGIKVAFLTSIYGISFSIAFTVSIKNAYSRMSESYTAFMERFHAYVFPTAENESRNLLIASQKLQTNMLNVMMTQFSSSLADSFEKVITPAFQKMSESIDVMISNVNQFQEDAVRSILNEFLRQMNQSFKMQFSDFNAALAQMTKAQKDNTEYTASLYQTLCEQLAEAYNAQERSLQKMSTELMQAQDDYIASASRVLKDNQDIQKQQQMDYQHIVDYMRESEKTSSKFWVACNQAMQKYLEAAAESMEKAIETGEQSQDLIHTNEEMIRSNQELNRSNKEIAEAFNENMKEYVQYQSQTYKTMEKVRILLSDISVAKGGDDVVLVGSSSRNEGFERLERVITEQMEAQQAQLAEMNNNILALTKAMTKSKSGLFRK